MENSLLSADAGSSKFEGLKRRIYAVRGRQARPAKASTNLLKTLAQAVFMWGAFFVIGPFAVLWIERKLSFPHFLSLHFSGVVLFMVGWVLSWTSAYFMVMQGDGTPLPLDATNKLVVDGPYRYIRNPMAVGALGQGFAIGLLLGSPLILLYIVSGGILWNFLVRPWEENDLVRKFGEPYSHYKKAVRCWTPRLRPY